LAAGLLVLTLAGLLPGLLAELDLVVVCPRNIHLRDSDLVLEELKISVQGLESLLSTLEVLLKELSSVFVCVLDHDIGTEPKHHLIVLLNLCLAVNSVCEFEKRFSRLALGLLKIIQSLERTFDLRKLGEQATLLLDNAALKELVLAVKLVELAQHSFRTLNSGRVMRAHEQGRVLLDAIRGYIEIIWGRD